MAELSPQNRVTKRKKLQRLPPNVKVQKRPLLRPPIPSPHAGSSQPKIIYVSARTPFLSAVKRVEKLLHFADKRLVQSATTITKQNRSKPSNKRKRGNGDEDEILDIAQEVERQKNDKRGTGEGEEVVLKGTGKAINKVLELGLWFQQREDEYVVRLRTGSVGAIDDITVDDEVVSEASEEQGGSDKGKATDHLEADTDADSGVLKDVYIGTNGHDRIASAAPEQQTVKPSKEQRQRQAAAQSGKIPVDSVPETRIRYNSVLEVAVSLR